MNLLDLGLHRGDTVRYRRRDDQRWKDATVARIEADGSVGLRDPDGASLSLPVERLQVRGAGPRGRLAWMPLTERLEGCEQLGLF